MTPEQPLPETLDAPVEADGPVPADALASDVDDEADDEGSAGSVWLTIGLFVVFIVGVSGCFAFQAL